LSKLKIKQTESHQLKGYFVLKESYRDWKSRTRFSIATGFNLICL